MHGPELANSELRPRFVGLSPSFLGNPGCWVEETENYLQLDLVLEYSHPAARHTNGR